MAAYLFALLSVAGFFIGCVYSLPVEKIQGNDTISYREQKASMVKFPPETTVSRNLTEWSRFSSANMSRATPAEGDIWRFPDDDMPKPTPKFTPVVNKRPPACADGTTFCEDIDGYPGDYLTSVLSNRIDDYQAILGVDEVSEPGIGHRIDGLDENPLCASVEQVVYPKTAKTKDEKWLFVVNQPPYTQGVRIEKCLKTSDSAVTPCAFTEQFPIGYKTVCKQKYIFRKLVALDEGGKPYTDTFQLPSCCSCSVKTESLGARIASLRHHAQQRNTTPVKKGDRAN